MFCYYLIRDVGSAVLYMIYFAILLALFYQLISLTPKTTPSSSKNARIKLKSNTHLHKLIN